jgi:hypothetical protein
MVECLMDEAKTFISMSLIGSNNKIVWKDSLRLFPVSLDNLCKMFNVSGKLSKYDTRFNNISLFNKGRAFHLFKKYALQDSKHLMVLCKVEFNDSGYKTLGHLRRVNFNDKDLFIEYLLARLGLITESYTPSGLVSQITFSYIIKSGLANELDRKLLSNLEDNSVTNHRFNNLQLPVSMNPSDYGQIILNNFIQQNGVNINRFIVESGTRSYVIDSSEDGLVNNVRIQGAIDLSWKDYKFSEDVIKREIGKSALFFMDGVRILSKKQLNAKPISKLSIETSIKSNFITMDIETITQNNKLIPYLICAYNGLDKINSYAELSKGVINQKALFSNFITQLLTFFNNDSSVITVYAHNFSGFDGIFLMKHLLSYGKVEPLLHNGKLISIKVKLNVEGYMNKTIVFKDSMLLLPLSLRELCSAFNVTVSKGYFPFNLTNIFYKGLLPQIELWKNIPNNEYTSLIAEFTGKVWDFKAEAIKYCYLDCIALHEILTSFNELIFSHFKVNIINSLTLPSLAMKIYRSQFMPKNSIYQLLGNVEKDIRLSYTGGAVDVYIPHNRKNNILDITKAIFQKIFIYDANSLYPFIMAETPMPIGKPVAFSGDIRKMEPNAFGYFYCQITSPDYLDHPILQRRIKTANGYRTIAGLGSWTGWIFSGEMDNAIKLGYTFEIIKGYQFEKGNVFKDYITKMYNLRMEYAKGHPLNLVAKLLMNSLYGKFGMRLESTQVEMFDTSNEMESNLLSDMMDLYGKFIKDFIKLDNHIVTVRDSLLNYEYNENEDMFHGVDINIAIASAVTAGGRMWMSTIKNNPLFKLYYSDTDSAAIDRPLPSFMVGEALGQFKLEYIVKRAVFLAPKVYGLLTDDGKEIVKIKGITNEINPNIHIGDLDRLLILDSKQEFIQEKWYKKVFVGEITPQQVAYTLKVTSNKRESVYVDDIFNSTKPFYYGDLIKKD